LIYGVLPSAVTGLFVYFVYQVIAHLIGDASNNQFEAAQTVLDQVQQTPSPLNQMSFWDMVEDMIGGANTEIVAQFIGDANNFDFKAQFKLEF